MPPRPAWLDAVQAGYESGAASQFVLHGNVADRFLVPRPDSKGLELGQLPELIARSLLPRFDVVLSYDLGNGVRVLRGGQALETWPEWQRSGGQLPAQPRQAVAWLTQYFRYAANLARLGRNRLQVACVVSGAHLLAPSTQGWANYDLAAIALQLRDWASDGLLTEHSIASFLLTETLSDLHPLLAGNPRAMVQPVPLPGIDEIQAALGLLVGPCQAALAPWGADLAKPARALSGSTLAAVDALVRNTAHRGETLDGKVLADAKKHAVEQDCGGLVEFIESKKTLDDLHGMERVKAWLRTDLQLWRQDDLQAMPMGYLICGPVGTGKTFTVECIAGEAGVPVVKLKNFRDKWVGSTEGNLERIFRLVRALGRCYVFVDEADQSLGKRDAGGNDGGIGGRVYAMLAQEMSDTGNRGKVVWILATSRPDLVEVDLKRPGRVDVKIPLLPTATADESWRLLRALCKRRGMVLPEATPPELAAQMPLWLTPGAAEALAVKVYRVHRTEGRDPLAAAAACLADWRAPVAHETMQFQIRIAVEEASDAAFVPEAFRGA